jgi:hypothetical protein
MQPLLASPGVPGDVSLNCWRDPFILERPSQQQVGMDAQQLQPAQYPGHVSLTASDCCCRVAAKTETSR